MSENDYGKELLNAMHDNKEHTIAFAKKITDGKENVEVTFKKEEQVPMRYESEARCHNFHDAEVLGDYLKKYGGKHTVVLCNVGQMSIQCILDESAKNGTEVITMTPKYHPLVAPFTGMATMFVMKEFAAWVMRNRRLITEPNGKDLAMMLSQIRVSKKIAIESGTGKKSLNGIMVEQEINSSQKPELIELPEEMKIQVPIFVGRDEVDFTVDIAVECNRDDEVAVTISSPDFEMVKIREFDEMLAELKTVLPDGCVVGLGTVITQKWDYIGDDDD